MRYCKECEKFNTCEEMCEPVAKLVGRGEYFWRAGKKRKLLIWDLRNIPDEERDDPESDRSIIDMRIAQITPRQGSIIKLLIDGKTKNEIKRLLSISAWVMNYEVRRIKQEVALSKKSRSEML